jgi:AcrR family transcriptional regulator
MAALAVTPRRAHNMQARRARILAAARELLTQGGTEAFNLRQLARQADVTVPTLYNLIGNKEEILLALLSQVLHAIETRAATARAAEPLAQVEGVVLASIEIFAEDEAYYRSAFLAVEALSQSGTHHVQAEQLYAWGERLLTQGVLACHRAGLLRGRVRAEQLGELVLRAYRTSCRAWAFGHLSLAEFRAQALADLQIALAADAVDTLHARLARRIATRPAYVPRKKEIQG